MTKASRVNYRMWLNNYMLKQKLGPIAYTDTQIAAGIRSEWESSVEINGTFYSSGRGFTKAAAREMAAKTALEILEQEANT
ncbi:hypothetical protein AMATHDRAFT_6441 [Amanita thiersii Skay4041]|uniref:DRBM domain-containing protein n=1 Tax=Amanita thiersii Skay4041 TaxID=703135 RepID=A0A2A9NJC6_9AGAR|nr:hypothetical protein AMATHDRAFT_6441 [Amanita thiersii Skay4041]